MVKKAGGDAQARTINATADAQAKTINATADAEVLRTVGAAEGAKITAVGEAEAKVIQLKTDAVGQGNHAVMEARQGARRQRIQAGAGCDRGRSHERQWRHYRRADGGHAPRFHQQTRRAQRNRAETAGVIASSARVERASACNVGFSRRIDA